MDKSRIKNIVREVLKEIKVNQPLEYYQRLAQDLGKKLNPNGVDRWNGVAVENNETYETELNKVNPILLKHIQNQENQTFRFIFNHNGYKYKGVLYISKHNPNKVIFEIQ